MTVKDTLIQSQGHLIVNQDTLFGPEGCPEVPLQSLTYIINYSNSNCTPGSRSYSDLVDTWEDSLLHPPAHTQACSKAIHEVVSG